MKHITTTYLSDDCTRKATITVDKNSHYTIQRYFMWESVGWTKSPIKDRTYKHFHSAERASLKFIK